MQSRHSMIRRAGEMTGAEGFYRGVVQSNPRDPLAATVLADRYVRMAWEARGSGNASTVSPERYSVFQDYLRTAEQILIGACAQQPQFTPAWAVRLVTARGLQLGAPETLRRYRRLATSSPNDLYAQFAALQDLLPKWAGTWEMAHNFAWECANDSPPGSPNAALVVMYYLERLISDEVSGIEDLARDAQVRHEIAVAAQRSVQHPAFGAEPDKLLALSLFALIFSLLEDWPSAKDCFTRLGPYAVATGWEYFGTDLGAVFTDARQEAMSKA